MIEGGKCHFSSSCASQHLGTEESGGSEPVQQPDRRAADPDQQSSEAETPQPRVCNRLSHMNVTQALQYHGSKDNPFFKPPLVVHFETNQTYSDKLDTEGQ